MSDISLCQTVGQEDEQMELQNKKINFLGDSITQGVGTSGKEKIFLNLLKESAGLSTVRNYGISAT